MKEHEEEVRAGNSKLQKQVEKATAERNAAEGRSQRSAASLLKVKADLASMEIKLQVQDLYPSRIMTRHAAAAVACLCR